MRDKLLDILEKRLQSEKAVIFAYLFGSQACGKTGGLSDIDVAVYLHPRIDSLQYRLRLMESIIKATKTDRVDVIVLNVVTPLLQYQVVKDGVVVKDNRKIRLGFEMHALRKYLDTEHLRKTQMSYMRTHIGSGAYFG
jgi:predicted nucleotidyltransferase